MTKVLNDWQDIVALTTALTNENVYAYRGQEDAAWPLATSIEREYSSARADHEIRMLTYFKRHAEAWLQPHLIPRPKFDAFSWLGLMQHYGGVTRLLDVTRSPYVALFFALEPPGPQSRALWAINLSSCQTGCADAIASMESIPQSDALERVVTAQDRLISGLVHGTVAVRERWPGWRTFRGVLPADPWKPDSRQSAQQGLFLCAADVEATFAAQVRRLALTHPAQSS